MHFTLALKEIHTMQHLKIKVDPQGFRLAYNGSVTPLMNQGELIELLLIELKVLATYRALQNFDLSYGLSNAAMFAWRDQEYERLRALLN